MPGLFAGASVSVPRSRIPTRSSTDISALATPRAALPRPPMRTRDATPMDRNRLPRCARSTPCAHRTLCRALRVQYLYVDPTRIPIASLLTILRHAPRKACRSFTERRRLACPLLQRASSTTSRDKEVFTRSGMFHEWGVRFEQGFPKAARSATPRPARLLRGYVPIGPLVAAGRSFSTRNTATSRSTTCSRRDPSIRRKCLGGRQVSREVRRSLASGPSKIVGNIELRAMHALDFTVLKQKFTLGNDIFSSTRRVWRRLRLPLAPDG